MAFLILNADARHIPLADKSVQTVVTSPPYWGLRQYFFDKASILRHDLTEDERAYVKTELEKRGIKPRQ